MQLLLPKGCRNHTTKWLYRSCPADTLTMVTGRRGTEGNGAGTCFQSCLVLLEILQRTRQDECLPREGMGEMFLQPSGWAVMVKRFARASVEPQAEVVTAGILVGTVKASRVPKSLCQILPRGCQASTVS